MTTLLALAEPVLWTLALVAGWVALVYLFENPTHKGENR